MLFVWSVLLFKHMVPLSDSLALRYSDMSEDQLDLFSLRYSYAIQDRCNHDWRLAAPQD